MRIACVSMEIVFAIPQTHGRVYLDMFRAMIKIETERREGKRKRHMCICTQRVSVSVVLKAFTLEVLSPLKR